jgi:hypothetical protein
MNVKFRYTNRVACHFSVTNWSTTGCTIIHETSIPRCSEIMILNHMDASIQKCCDLKRSCTPASHGSHQKPNKFQNSNGQFFFRSRCFYRVGRGSGNKPYFIFGLIKYLTSTSKICLYIWNVTCSWTDTICPCQNIHRNAPGRAHHT